MTILEGMQVITTDKIQYMVDAFNYFKEKIKINIKQIKYLPQAQEIHFILETNTHIWIDMTYDFKSQINKLNFAKRKPRSKSNISTYRSEDQKRQRPQNLL